MNKTLWAIAWVAMLSPAVAIAADESGGKLTAALNSMRLATDPSGVVAAYGQAMRASPDDMQINQVYVQRMVQLDAPAMAFYQAQALVAANPRSGLGWIVIAYAQARQNHMIEALTAVARGAPLLTDDRFAQQVAGGLLAWYDAQTDLGLPENLKIDLENARTVMKVKTAYMAAYNQTKRDLNQQAAGQTGEPPDQPPGAAEQDSAADQYVPDTYSAYAGAGPAWWHDDAALAGAYYGYTSPWWVGPAHSFIAVQPFADFHHRGLSHHDNPFFRHGNNSFRAFIGNRAFIGDRVFSRNNGLRISIGNRAFVGGRVFPRNNGLRISIGNRGDQAFHRNDAGLRVFVGNNAGFRAFSGNHAIVGGNRGGFNSGHAVTGNSRGSSGNHSFSSGSRGGGGGSRSFSSGSRGGGGSRSFSSGSRGGGGHGGGHR